MNKKVVNWGVCAAATMLLSSLSLSASAADAEKDAKREVRKVQAQLSLAQKEKAEVIKEKEALAEQLSLLKKRLGEKEAKGAALEKKAGGQLKQVDELTEKYQDSEKNLQQMASLYSDLNSSQQKLQDEKERDHNKLEASVQVCEKKNAQLYEVSEDLMQQYKSTGLFSSLWRVEPVTQIKSVEMQNLLQEYRDKADAAKIKPAVNEVTAAKDDAQLARP
jgi:chromosome segregation ATPase